MRIDALLNHLIFSVTIATLALILRQSLSEGDRKFITLLIPPYVYGSLLIYGWLKAPVAWLGLSWIDYPSLTFGIAMVALSSLFPFKRLRLPGYIIGAGSLALSILGVRAYILMAAGLAYLAILAILAKKLLGAVKGVIGWRGGSP